MKRYLTLFLVLACFEGHAQDSPVLPKKKAVYTFNLMATPQLFLNGVDLEYKGDGPRSIRTRNTGGYTLGAELERRGKKGFIWNAGFQYGARHHSITMGYEQLGFFFPEAADKFNATGPHLEQHSGSTAYYKIRLMGGYRLPFEVLPGCFIEAKAGLSARLYRSGFEGDYYRSVTFIMDHTIYDRVIGEGHFLFGGEPYNEFCVLEAEWYVGLCRDVSTRFLKNINIGIEMTRAINVDKTYGSVGYAFMDTYRFGDTYHYPSYHERLIAKDLSIGIRFSAGLWYK